MFALDRLNSDQEYHQLMRINPKSRAEFAYFEDLAIILGRHIGFKGIMGLRDVDPLRIYSLSLARKSLEEAVAMSEGYTELEVDELIKNYEEAMFKDSEAFTKHMKGLEILAHEKVG